VRVNCIAPGLHKTLMWKYGSTQEKYDQYVERWIDNNPLHKVGEPEDMVGPTLFFLSSASSYMTGQVIFQDGGKSIWF
jgi:NAD(P)-dependent dehydrogenase (short-subunit alcohol dehydrogenase family)